MHHLGFVCFYGPVVGYLHTESEVPSAENTELWKHGVCQIIALYASPTARILIFTLMKYTETSIMNSESPFPFDQINVFHLGRTFMVTEHQLSGNYLYWEAICSEKRPMGYSTDLRLMPCTCVSNNSWQKRSLYAVVCVLLMAVETLFVCFGRELSHLPIKDCMSHAASRLELLMKACDQSVSQRPLISAGVPQTKKFSSPPLAAQSY